MKAKNILILTSYFLILILLSGCATTYEGRSYGKDNVPIQRALEVAYILRFEDVPVPSGFKILEDESFAFQNDATRVVLLKYKGPKNLDQATSFYKEQMPLYNWNPINIIEYERRVLNYEKESESCIVTLEPDGRKSMLTIAISPKSRPMKVQKVRIEK